MLPWVGANILTTTAPCLDTGRAPPTRHVVYSRDPPSAQCVGGVGASTCASVQDTRHLYLVLGWRAPAQPPSPDLGPVTDTELEQVASSSQIAAECKLKVNISPNQLDSDSKCIDLMEPVSEPVNRNRES